MDMKADLRELTALELTPVVHRMSPVVALRRHQQDRGQTSAFGSKQSYSDGNLRVLPGVEKHRGGQPRQGALAMLDEK